MGMIRNRFPVLVEVMMLRKGSILVDTEERARRMIGTHKKMLTGEEYYQLKKNKIRLPVAYFSDVVTTVKGKDKIYLWSPSPKHYFPISVSDMRDLQHDAELLSQYANQVNAKFEFVDREGNLVKNEDGTTKKLDLRANPRLFPRDTDIDNWNFNEYRRANEMWVKRNDLAKWIPIIMLVVAAVGVAIILQASTAELSKTSANFAGFAGAWQKTSENQLKLFEQQYALIKALALKEGIAVPTIDQLPPF